MSIELVRAVAASLPLSTSGGTRVVFLGPPPLVSISREEGTLLGGTVGATRTFHFADAVPDALIAQWGPRGQWALPAEAGAVGEGGGARIVYQLVDLAPADSAADGVAYAFAKRLLPIEQVKAVSYEEDHGTLRFWTYIPSRDRAVRQQIYAQEARMLEECQNWDFDFVVVSISNDVTRPPSYPGRVVLYRR